MEVRRVDVADVVARQARFAVYGYMRLPRSFSSGDDGDRYGTQARDQDVDRQDNDRVIPCPGKARSQTSPLSGSTAYSESAATTPAGNGAAFPE